MASSDPLERTLVVCDPITNERREFRARGTVHVRHGGIIDPKDVYVVHHVDPALYTGGGTTTTMSTHAP